MGGEEVHRLIFYMTCCVCAVFFHWWCDDYSKDDNGSGSMTAELYVSVFVGEKNRGREIMVVLLLLLFSYNIMCIGRKV